MTTFLQNGTSYDLQIAGGVLQTRVSGSSAWISHPTMVGIQSAYVAVASGDGVSYLAALLADGSYLGSELGLQGSYPLTSAEYSHWVSIGTLISGPAAPVGPVSTFETALSMSGHQIVDAAPGVAPSDVVVVSQLSALSVALTTAFNAGDLVNANAIVAANLRIDNLPAGITLAQVQATADAAAMAAFAANALTDEQRQAFVVQLQAQLTAADTAFSTRVSTVENDLIDLESRVSVTEVKNTSQDTAIAALEAKDVAQDAAIAAAAAAALSAVTSNVAQEVRLGNIEVAAATVNQAITPVEVQVRAGVVTSAVGVALGDVSIDNSNTTHMTVSINLGSANAGKRRVDQGFRVMANGAEEKLGHAPTRLGEVYSFTFLKERAGSTAVNLLLN